jgi:predicted 3-demethylubiquinone-9 3-methyltransferase (glyoxalase superfamily)
MPQKVSTCFWFDNGAEDAAKLYTSLIPNSKITNIARYGKGAPLPEGTVLMVNFTLDGVAYSGLNGGPVFKPNEAASIVVACEDQAEIDKIWNALTADGGQESQCGWCKDRWGISWQVVPAQMDKWVSGPHGAKVMQAFMPMKKLDIATLEAAARG